MNMMDLRTQEVHSGHFMVSNLEDSEDESENSVDLSPEDITSSILKDVNDQPATKDKNRLIFENLASLFKYLEIAYIGKLTSPKWDQFRGLRFAIKNKIRLNNIIWREYHMQYVKKLKPVVVQFQTPVCENHSKAEAVVLEGKYWRRRISALCREYGLWRLFAKNKLYGSHNKQIVQCANELLEESDMCSYKFRDLPKNASSKLLEEIMMDIDENLDLFFEQPLTFPNPRDLPTLGNADIMQPGLQQLQPNRSLREDISSRNSELPSLTIQRNLPASSSINCTFPYHNSGQYSFPNSSNQVSNMFVLPSNEHVHGSLDDSNSELETLVPGSWNEPQMFSHTMSIGPNEMEQSTEAMVTKDSSLNVNKINAQSSVVENSATMRGRSNSAGNLFSLQNNHLNSCSVQGSAATTSSYGSTEILSPMFTNHKGFLCTTSPSCSPPSVSEQNDQPGKPTVGNSSEERRRQSMQSGLQTLRQLLKMYSNVDNLAGGNRFSARRNINNLEGKSSVSCTYTSADTEIPNEKLPVGMQSSSGLDLGSDEQTISSVNEIGGNGRGSKAATLRSAAELIRKLRDERNLLEVQCTNLKGEVKALQNAISLCCEKLPSSGSTSLLSTSDPNSNAYYSEWFRAYVHKQTEANWKFYVFSLIISGIFKSYCTTTVTNSRDQFVRSVYGWLDTNCSLIKLRPAVMQALCTLGKTTSVLQEPNKLPEQSRISSIENLF
uniref:BHLH domain-containing protein n=1 Tax=Trichobilharzia regenti TaxID=157069 RepID=A0AA85KDH3_TRIRE|nr:unnamed protein product [Trichobilharzia regenti]